VSLKKRQRKKNSSEVEDDDGKNPPLTELQILIIKAIQQTGGSANFEQILEHVKPSFEKLRRRNGSPYTSECRRALLASLSNNPASKPFFKKEKSGGTNSWSLAKRSLEYLELWEKKTEEEKKESLHDLATTSSSSSNGHHNGNHHNSTIELTKIPSESVEEEIVDEEEGEENGEKMVT